MYTQNDIEAIKEEMPKIKDEIQKIKLNKFDPTLKEIKIMLIH